MCIIQTWDAISELGSCWVSLTLLHLAKVVLWAVVHVAISLSSSGNILLSLEFVSKGIVSWPLNKWMFFSAVILDYSVLS